ncbi:MAG: LysM peptidoglycan-binding domain-containing protein [Deltaproteobacteria bacterium]|nr:LysM peptidoglycan-binding domain-containing protein [Deltaproteobacteria bacterium]MBT6489824.1 LysM peptidoglycan-binding domain-containing protein [Deltaproteobacteria bacterium]
MNMKHLSVVLVVTALATVGLIGAVSVYAQSVDEETVSDDFQPNKNQHLVEDGDTLWDICEAVLGRPELWPRVWSMNPEITNPHWIYPGDIIRFEVPTEDLPSMDIMAEALTGVQKSGEDEEDTETVGEQEEEEVLAYDDFLTQKSPPIEVIAGSTQRRVPPENQPQRAFLNIFLTKKQLEEQGRLVNAAPDRLLLASGDTVYVKFADGVVPKPGTRYVSYRTIKEVNHPKSGDFFGYMTQITGMFQVVNYREGVGTARVLRAVAEMERGQLVAPLLQSPLVTVYPTRADKVVDGVILAVQNDHEAFVAQGNYVFIDRGSVDGVTKGQRFKVYRFPVQFAGAPEEVARLDIGTLMVVDAKDKASTCLVVNANQEISPGDAVRTMP